MDDPVIEPRAVARWRRHPCTGGVMLFSPDDATRIRIRPRLVTIPRLRAVLADALEVGSGALEVSAPQQLVTDEGELAWLASASATVGGRAIAASVGLAGDEPCTCIEVVGADHRAPADALLRSTGLGLEAIRCRWFSYAPPPGWSGVRRDRATTWLHPAFPRTPARITVFDARPLVDSATEKLHRFLFVRLPDGLYPLEPLAVEDVVSAQDMTGRLRILVGTWAGRRTVRMASVHADDRFAYVANVEAPADDAEIEQAFRTMIASFAPVPRRPARLEIDAF